MLAYRIHIIEINEDGRLLAVCHILQQLHVLQLVLTPPVAICAVHIVDHVAFVAVAIAVEVQSLELLGSFCGRRLEVFEEVNNGL